jgi:hypothetical protein
MVVLFGILLVVGLIVCESIGDYKEREQENSKEDFFL